MPSRSMRLFYGVRNLTLAATDLYAAAILFYLLARVGLGWDWWVLILAGHFLHWLLLPAFVLIPLLLWRQRWLSVGLLATHIVAFIFIFGALFVPKSEAVNRADLKVLTYNIASYRTTPQQIADYVLETEADIVAMQEVGTDHAAYFDEVLRPFYPYVIEALTPGNVYNGKLLFSRYPILEYDFFTATEERQHIHAVLDIDGTPVHVFNVHLWVPEMFREEHFYREYPANPLELQQMLDQVDPSVPTIILGDHNFTDQHAHYDQMQAAGLTDVFRAVGWGFGTTFPARLAMVDIPAPLVRIDYVWVTDAIMPLKAEVGTDAGSDHMPLLAYLDLQVD